MTDAVADASAVLAILRGEVGAADGLRAISRAAISAVNYAEVISRLVDLGASVDDAVQAIGQLDIEVASFDETGAVRTGALRQGTRARGLSLGDRACLALAHRLGLPAVTADRAWASLDLGVEVVLIR
ncbi:MAG TPA: type II toxin-antitoxin system VapC family toxin [Phenylobacterium sp.]|nr:type II toxin-antitoxin system VapC family toxin [Phenylobacterium sp.]